MVSAAPPNQKLSQGLANPFRGLRPFGVEEDHLFFGREQIVDQLLMRLRKTRFLSIIGSSGCGKSSLLQAGMIPSLYSGYMATAGSSWRVAIMRPGGDPIGNLAKVLTQPDILGEAAGLEETSQILTEATLMRSVHGLADCVRLARMPAGENLLVVVDQFEELFRFKQSRATVSSGGDPGEESDQEATEKAIERSMERAREKSREEAVAFVKRLIHAAAQSELPIYIALTMRSDFIGECNEYPGLPEAINEGQFLVPRMTRTELRSAIVGPIKVGGADISPRLLVRLLNDVGDSPDRLPILQHAMMRTWDYWQTTDDELIDVQHYEAVGTMEHALSSHAEEAFAELGSKAAKTIAEKVFKALTDTISDSRGVRYPTGVGELCQIAQAEFSEVCRVVDVFRQRGRSFLMPPAEVPLSPDTIVDLSHESLMRVWGRLQVWTSEENTSARRYRRLARAAARYEDGTAALWRDPELEIGLRWRDEVQPTRAWASRYNPAVERSMGFLDASRAERDREFAERRKARKRRLQTAWGVSLVLLIFAVYALVQQHRAVQEQLRAEQNFHLAVRAVDEMLGDVAVENSLANIPQTEALRQQLLEKARRFYESLQQDSAADLDLQLETAVAQVRLGKIYQLQGQPSKAAAVNEEAISQLRKLQQQFPDHPQIEYRLGEAYDWYGVQIMPYDAGKAEKAYGQAQALHQALVKRFPETLDYQHELARVFNNRGILLGSDSERTEEAERNFRQSVALFESLASARNDARDLWRLSRTQNGLAGLLRRSGQAEEAIAVYNQAIVLVRKMLQSEPEKREYREGLARFYNNLANLHLTLGHLELALDANAEARQLFEALAVPIPELRNEIANSYNTRGAILRGLNRTPEAASAIEKSVSQFEDLERDSPDFEKDPALNARLGGTLASLAILRSDVGKYKEAIQLLSRAIGYFLTAVNSPSPSSGYQRNLANAYWLLADNQLKADDHGAAVIAAELFVTAGASNKSNGDIKNNLFSAAHLFGRATLVLNADKSLDALQRSRLTESYTSRTLVLLELAVGAGLSPASILKESQAKGVFHHLRNHGAFQRITAGGEQG